MENVPKIIDSGPMNIGAVLAHVSLVQQIMKTVMKEGEHYGVIPGTKKPTLYKSGAEKLNMTFRLTPKYEVNVNELGNGHREYEVVCNLYSMGSDVFLGSGIGECTTMESKYRYRTGPSESTGKVVPAEYWKLRDSDPIKARELLGGPGFITKKGESGKWEIFMQGEKVEYENPADYYNTVKKMAKKRAFVDAILTVTAASDIFTQDVEDLIANGTIQPDPKKQTEGVEDKEEGQGRGSVELFNKLAKKKTKGNVKLQASLFRYIEACSNYYKTTEYQVKIDASLQFDRFFVTFEQWAAKQATQVNGQGQGKVSEDKAINHTPEPDRPSESQTGDQNGESVKISCPKENGEESRTLKWCSTSCNQSVSCQSYIDATWGRQGLSNGII